MNKILFILITTFLFLNFQVNSAFAFALYKVDRDIKGKVIDAETNMPLEGVAVYASWSTSMPTPAGPKSKLYDNYETVTDENGSFTVKGLGIKLLTTLEGPSISVFKAGYFKPTVIVNPPRNNLIKLHKIKYYLDYIHYKESALKDEMGLSSSSMSDVASIQMEGKGKDFFVEIPGTQLTKLYRRKISFKDKKRHDLTEAHIRRMRELIYYVFDEVSEKWFAIDVQGNIKEFDNNLLYDYKYFGSDYSWGNATVYANSDIIFLPADDRFKDRTINPPKGNITSLGGDSDYYLTIEDDGKSICYFSIYDRTGYGCISIAEILNKTEIDSDEPARITLLAGPAEPDKDAYFVIKSVKAFHVCRIFGPSNPYRPAGHRPESLIDPSCFSFPVNNEIIAIDNYGSGVVVLFEDNQIRKFGSSLYSRGQLKEQGSFFMNVEGAVSSIVVGETMWYNAIYYSTGTSKVYRISLDGTPDFQGKISFQ